VVDNRETGSYLFIYLLLLLFYFIFNNKFLGFSIARTLVGTSTKQVINLDGLARQKRGFAKEVC
jgi:hypothetical protein